jgi:transcriptional/translational regulatory protein YebC/TACO1
VTWLEKFPDGTDSSLTLKKKIFTILLSMNMSDEHVDRASELKKLIQKGKKNAFTKDLCEAIINKWGGNII